MKKIIILTGITGAIGSLLYFLGDMLLYFTTNPVNPDSGMDAYAGIMSELPLIRIMTGGFIGLMAAFCICIGYWQLYVAIRPQCKKLKLILLGLLLFGEIMGGAYHSQFSILGFMYSESSENGIRLLIENISILGNMTFCVLSLGYIILTILIILGKTVYPRWFFLITPISLVWLIFAIQLLPQPLYIVFAGGWNSLIFFPFFLSSTWFLLKNEDAVAN
ncbi:MAG: hypothetical protein LBI90_00815 [Treponema sp.]|jgi:hypothetical protein|nr:hypothetical protein [Treponema sp.]